MHHPRRGSETTSRNSLWFLRQPCGLEKPGRQSFPSWFLLAHGHLRCRRPRSTLRRRPIFHQANTCVGTRAADHPSFLALRMLGTGYDWAFQASARWFLVRVHNHRQVLESGSNTNCLFRLLQRRQLSSLKISSTDSVSRTASSRTSGPHSLVIIFGTSAKTDVSPSNTSLLSILEPTARSNGRTA